MATFEAYLPVHALRKIDIDSMLSVALPGDSSSEIQRLDYHHSRRAMIHFLLSLDPALCKNLPQSIATRLSDVNWEGLKVTYGKLKDKTEPYKAQNYAEQLDDPWELHFKQYPPGPKKSMEYIQKYRSEGFFPKELKLYWNYEEIRQLVQEKRVNKETDQETPCNTETNQEARFNPETDQDTHKALMEFPVYKRKHKGTVRYKITGIEKAVFDVAEKKQIIVLDFADERMPGGYFLENARTQEEVRRPADQR